MTFFWGFMFNDFAAVFSKGKSSPDQKDPGSASLQQKRAGSPLSIKVIIDIPLTILKVGSV